MVSMSTFILTLLTLAVFQVSQAQKEEKALVDSLHTLMTNMNEDTNKIILLYISSLIGKKTCHQKVILNTGRSSGRELPYQTAAYEDIADQPRKS